MEQESYPAIDGLNVNISELVQRSSAIKINNDLQMGESSDVMKLMKTLLKKVDESEKSFTKPLNDTVKKLRLQFKPLKETINFEIKALQGKQSGFLIEKRKQEQIEADKKKAEFEANALDQAEKMEELGMNEAAEKLVDVAAEVQPKEAKVQSRGNYSSTSLRRSLSYEVSDFDKVPDNLKIINDKAVKELLIDLKERFKREASEKGITDATAVTDYVYKELKAGGIPGIKIEIKETVVTR